MLSKILGAIWIVLGAFWLVRPQTLKDRLKRKMGRRTKRVVYVFVIVFGFLMIGSVIKAPGLSAKVVGIIGMIITIKAIMLLTSKASLKIATWLADRPLIFFRIWAILFLAIGLMLIFV
ncbi:MAG: hypothetical protein U9R44_03540 [Candidatus Omnitrophota bacterium]|nr:hypothetical protein [Candidatus Omnitrophota bacterium]